MIEWLDYPVDLMRSDYADKGDEVMRHALAHLFITAARQGWDMEQDVLHIARRTERWDTTIRIARSASIELIEKWAQRGWNVIPLDDTLRAQMLRLLPPKAAV